MSRVYNTKCLKLFHGDAIEELKEIPDNRIDAMVTDPPAGIAFMNKSWDKDKGGRDNWIADMAQIYAECLRVMKPGAHGLVWAIPRTSHWTATALEDAGFEVRDRLSHFFGSGFPKNMNVAKKGAEEWDGWGTALKPAVEDWICVRKPIAEKTVVANLLKYGTGAINIDGCRIAIQGEKIHVPQSNPAKRSGVVGTDLGISNADTDKFQAAQRASVEKANELGRYPSHLLLSHSDQCKPVGQQTIGSGEFKKGNGKRPGGFVDTGADKGDNKPCGPMYGQETVDVYECVYDCPVRMLEAQCGGASRFFYVAKPSGKEKNDGLDDFEATNVNDGRKTSINNPYQRGDSLRKNTHPTVKPIKLMEYLCTLITPPNGIILDPFMGSGTTGIAALNKGFRFVGIEREEEYLEIAQARLLHAIGEEIAA